MRSFLIVTLMLATTFSSHAANKKEITRLNEPVVNYIAEAVAIHLKRVQTVGGFVRWASEYMSKEEETAFRKWIAKHNLPEDQYFPDFKVKQNTVYYGRDRLSIYEDRIVLNGKTYKFSKKKTGTYVGYLDQFCKDLNCQGRNTSLFQKALFPEAEAIADWLLYGLIFTGGWLARGWWQKWRARRKASNQNMFGCEGWQVTCRSVSYTTEELVDIEPGENYKCTSGELTIETDRETGGVVKIYNRSGRNLVGLPDTIWTQQFQNCEQAALEINKYARNNDRFPEPVGTGGRSVTGEKDKKAK